MISGMALPSTPSLMAIAMAATQEPSLAILSTYLGHVDPAIHTGISRPHRNCWSWPAIGLSVTSEVTHDRTCHDFAGVLH